jgi:hypothetical protein
MYIPFTVVVCNSCMKCANFLCDVHCVIPVVPVVYQVGHMAHHMKNLADKQQVVG